MKSFLQRFIACILMMFAIHAGAFAQSDPIEKVWLNGQKTGKIQIYKAKDGKFYGKIVWLAEPNRDGKPKLDINNSNAKLRTRPVMGLLILRGFEKDGDDEYDGGTIYDPKNGKTYSCVMTLKGDKLDVRGYVGVSLLGRTDTWTVAD